MPSGMQNGSQCGFVDSRLLTLRWGSRVVCFPYVVANSMSESVEKKDPNPYPTDEATSGVHFRIGIGSCSPVGAFVFLSKKTLSNYPHFLLVRIDRRRYPEC